MLKKILIMMTLLTSIHSKAFIGAVANDDTTAIVGLAMMDISQVTVVERRSFFYSTIRVFTYVPLFLFGLVILDEEGKITFTEMTKEKAEKAGITSDEMKFFNDEIEEVNATKDDIASEISLIKNQEEKAQEALNIWEEYSKDNALAPQTFRALQKLIKASL